jgi:methylmalonyl-CoA mutase
MSTTATTKPTSLFADFAAASPADWRKAAEESLDGAPFEKKLITRTYEGIDLRPIYTREDTATLPESWPGLPPYTRGSDPLGQRAQGWSICQEADGTDATAFNAALLSDLKCGQNAVSLPLQPAVRLGLDPAKAGLPTERGLALTSVNDVDRALRGVDLSAVPVFAHAGVAAGAVTALLTAWLKVQGRPATDLHGAILADPIGELVNAGTLPVSLEKAYDEMAQLELKVRTDGLALRTVGVNAALWAEAGANAVQELAFGLASGVEYLRALNARGLTADQAAPRFLFTYALGSNLFMEIAKLRAARLLWARAVEAAGGGAAAQRLVCHGRTTRWNKTVLDQHANLLRTTTEAFAGIVGGCAGLQVGTFDEVIRPGDDFSRRLARNIQIILDEECHLGRVVDPAGGSYYVETLTNELAAKAWALFQDIEGKGGLAAALSAGYPQSLVEKTATEKMNAVETRRDAIIGTNLHPNLREKLPVAEACASGTCGCCKNTKPVAVEGSITVKRLVPRRRAEAFEALRRRTEAALTATGVCPQVFLATFGPRKQHAPRAEFSAGFFAAGGFEAVSGKSSETPEAAAQAALASGARVVVLCSTDDTYPVLVPATVQLLKTSVNPPLVVLAGMPATPELQKKFTDAGVDEFIHVRANCAKVLAGFLDKLGL